MNPRCKFMASLCNRYGDDQPMLHDADGHGSRYLPLSPRAPWPAQPPSEEWHGAHDTHQHPMGPEPHPYDAANFQHQPGHLDRSYEQQAHGEQYDHGGQAPVGEGQRHRHRRGGRRHRRPMLAAYPGWVTLLTDPMSLGPATTL